VEIVTATGLARLCWHASDSGPPSAATGLLLLGHGAGGGITAPDLLRVSDLAHRVGMAIGLVEQPYRVAGRRAPAPAAQLDAAFTDVVVAARDSVGIAATRPLIVGGRSSGARVACRTAQAVGAHGVLALAFPLQPPRPAGREAPSRLRELVGAGVPVLVVQGDRDRFGSAETLREALKAHDFQVDTVTSNVAVSTAAGADHALRKGVDAAMITSWLAGFLP
jgi:predicted alpha/beta-hydrolase family hydrolase